MFISEKSKMLDITRDRPVKVAVKVAVPVRDHPKVNKLILIGLQFNCNVLRNKQCVENI